MAYRANLFDFGAVAGSAGGANAAANDAAFAAALASPVHLIEMEQEIFEISQPIIVNKDGKRFVGAGYPDLWATMDLSATRLDWYGAAGATMAGLAPNLGTGRDLLGAGWENTIFHGRNIAGVGFVDKATRRALVKGIQVGYVTSIGVYFVKLPAGEGHINVSAAGRYEDITVNVNDGAIGVLFDGATGGKYHFNISHMNGIACYLRNCDTLDLDISTARGPGGTGVSVLLDGAGATPVLGNVFSKLHVGAHDGDVHIQARGELCRLNDILFLDGVDNKANQPIITKSDGAELFYNFTGRAVYPPTTPTLLLEKGLRRMPKRSEATY